MSSNRTYKLGTPGSPVSAHTAMRRQPRRKEGPEILGTSSAERPHVYKPVADPGGFSAAYTLGDLLP